MFHVFVVTLAVSLHPQCVHCRAFALVEHPALQIGGIGCQTHHTAESIQFAYQRSFCRAADAGIAGHIADGVQTHGKHSCLCTQRRSGMGGFDTGMTGTDDDDIIIS